MEVLAEIIDLWTLIAVILGAVIGMLMDRRFFADAAKAVKDLIPRHVIEPLIAKALIQFAEELKEEDGNTSSLERAAKSAAAKVASDYKTE